MALVVYLDWEVRTTGHDLNCSGFNPARDATNGVDYTQQDNAEITSLSWYVDASNNTWIRSTDLTNWVSGGKTLASLKGNHIHLAGMAIAGGVLFQWNPSSGKPGAYYLQALGGGNPSWTTKPTRVWLNKTYTVENTSLPSGSNTWAWGDWDSLGYSTIYVRFGAESDVDPDSKNQDDVIADGETWTRGAYEITNVGTDGSGPYLVLDRSPAAVSSQAGYGRIGGAMYTSGGIVSIDPNSGKVVCWVRPGTYTLNRVAREPGGFGGGGYYPIVIGYDTVKGIKPSNYPVFDFTSQPTGWGVVNVCSVWLALQNMKYEYRNGLYIGCILTNCNMNGCRIEACYVTAGTYGQNRFIWSYVQNIADHASFRSNEYAFCVIVGGTNRVGINSGRSICFNNVVYNRSTHGLTPSSRSDGQQNTINGVQYFDSNVVVNCSGYAINATSDCPEVINNRLFYYACTLGGAPVSTRLPSGAITQLPGNPFRDPDNGDFRLADNEAGRMLKQAGFQIPGPQGAPPMKFDAGAVQNSFYDIASGGAFVLPPRIIGA